MSAFFSGTQVGTATSGTEFPTDLEINSGFPRTVVLADYFSTTVAVSLDSNESAYAIKDYTVTPYSSGSPFTSSWTTNIAEEVCRFRKRRRSLKLLVHSLEPVALQEVLVFAPSGINTSSTWTLRISQSFILSSITNSSTLTLLVAPNN